MPTPKAVAIVLTEKQQQVLEQIVRRTINPYRLVRRAQIILAAASGMTNREISERWSLDRGQVRLWRQRWAQATSQLEVIAAGGTLAELESAITRILADDARPGTPPHFGVEQVVQIVALACEAPTASNRPISAWTARELAQEAVQRGIVKTVSPRSVGRFLKGSQSATASQSLLAQRQPG
jgi:putative transposase